MKGNKGITLIALVITIIVLLILAAVSIAMLTGDNSILGNAAKSADYNKIGEVKDQIALKVNEYTTAYLESKYNNTTWDTTNNGTAPSSDTDAVLKAVASFVTADSANSVTAGTNAPTNGCKVVYNAPTTGDSAADGYVDIVSNDYYVTGTVKATGKIIWQDITKGTPSH